MEFGLCEEVDEDFVWWLCGDVVVGVGDDVCREECGFVDEVGEIVDGECEFWVEFECFGLV